MKGAVEPRLSRGLRDLLSEPMLARQRMIETIRGVYELYGFVPLGTPAVEYLDVLTGTAGQETQQSIFTVRGPEDEALGLRFDLTVPLARVVAQYHDLPRPFRRYQVSPVWRADKPGPGRYREFIQFDLDSVGVESEIADTEIIAGMCDTLTALAVGPFRVRFSSRGILDLMLAAAGGPGCCGCSTSSRRSAWRRSSSSSRPATRTNRATPSAASAWRPGRWRRSSASSRSAPTSARR